MGTWQEPIWKRGERCVIKELKDNFTWNPSDWDTTKLVQEEAQKMAKGFNAFSKTNNLANNPIKFTGIDVMQVSSRSDTKVRPLVGESVIVEEYIEGNFKKWCNNYGFISPLRSKDHC